MTRLPPELRQLAGRLAVERLRSQQWSLAADLRQQLLRRIAAGEPVDQLVADLHRAIDEAAARPR